MMQFEFNSDPAIARFTERVLIPAAGVFRDRNDLADFCYTQADLWQTGGDPGDEKIAAFLNSVGDRLATAKGYAKALEKIKFALAT